MRERLSRTPTISELEDRLKEAQAKLAEALSRREAKAVDEATSKEVEAEVKMAILNLNQAETDYGQSAREELLGKYLNVKYAYIFDSPKKLRPKECVENTVLRVHEVAMKHGPGLDLPRRLYVMTQPESKEGLWFHKTAFSNDAPETLQGSS